MTMKYKSKYNRYNFALPTIKDLRPVDPVLTDMSIGFKNERYFWDQIGPVKEVPEPSGTFFLYTRDYWFRRQEGAERGPTSPYTRVGFGATTATYQTLEYGFEQILGDPTVAASQTPENIETLAVEYLTHLLQIEMEKLASAEFFVTGKWGTSNTLSGGDQWSDFANSDPIADADAAIRTVRRGTGTAPNYLFMGLLAWEKLKEHPLILDKYKHTQSAIMTPELVAAVLSMDELVVGDSVENTAAEKAPGTASFTGADIWTDNALFVVKNAPGLSVPNGAVNFIWNERGNVPWAAETYRSDDLRSTIARIFTHLVPKVVSSQHGYLLLDTVA